MMKKYIYILILVLSISSCSNSFLEENPPGFNTPEETYTNTEGFNTALNGLLSFIRLENQAWTNTVFAFSRATPYETLHVGLDVAQVKVISPEPSLSPFETYTFNNTDYYVSGRWTWAYGLISKANMMLDFSEKNNVSWDNTKDNQDKLFFQANARFSRAYAYRTLVYLWGDVPWVNEHSVPYRNDFTRTPKAEVLQNMINDLEFAAQYLPGDPTKVLDGQLTKWAALHLLSEICISANQFDRAISAAQEIINSPYFILNKQRFGVSKDSPGDPFSDMFKDGNHNYKTGNKESIWVIQDEYNVPGGAGEYNDWTRRAWLPAYYNIKGFIISVEYGGRGNGQIRPSDYFFSLLEDSDMRNSEYNIRRNYYYNDPSVPDLLGRLHVITQNDIDYGYCFPSITKFDYAVASNLQYAGNNKDKTRMRLAETYLLLAEAYIMKNNISEATKAINVVRQRANATLATVSEVNMDYLLDERARELIGEEVRRFTLVRTGKLLERTRKHNPVSGSLIQDKHVLWPIPQNVLDANSGNQWKDNWND